MPMIPELPIAMLACARIGAPFTVVFGGFSAEALAGRIEDAQAKLVITADGGWRRGKATNLKQAADDAMAESPTIERALVVRRIGDAGEMPIVMWTRMNGSTIGMRVLKLGVRDASSGSLVNQQQAIRRWAYIGLPGALGLAYVLPLIGILVSLGVLAYYIFLLVTTAQSPTRQGFHVDGARGDRGALGRDGGRGRVAGHEPRRGHHR